MQRRLIIFLIICFNVFVRMQAQREVPKIWINVSKEDSCVVVLDRYSDKRVIFTDGERKTNYNTTISLDDTVIRFIYDGLREDSVVTVMSVYETEEDSIVGVWEIDRGENTQIWLNSERVSYGTKSLKYREKTEKGVVINTMLFEYMKKEDDTTYVGEDTLYIGQQGENKGAKNFCEYIYFQGELPYKEQRITESCLAVKYGALLHKCYVDRNLDTLWNTEKGDSAYSYGVCGVGRDDNFPLNQRKSEIRKDFLTVEVMDTLEDLSYIMLGHNEYANELSEEVYYIDTVKYHQILRKWKMRSHTDGREYYTRFEYEVPEYLKKDKVRLFLNKGDNEGNNTMIYVPKNMTDERVVFDSVLIEDGVEYYISIRIEGEDIFVRRDNKISKEEEGIGEKDMDITLTPNPTNTGEFEIRVRQTEGERIIITITDNKGQIVRTKDTGERVKEYKYKGYIAEQGVYVVTVQRGETKRSIKLVVVK